jgi:hypothetical protein
MKLSRAIAIPLVLFASPLTGQQPPTTRTTQVMVLFTAKPGIERELVRKFVQEEVKATVRLCLNGKIRDWYSCSDGKGVVLIVNAASTTEAQAFVETLPLARANLVDHHYTELGPLAPLYNLVGGQPAK